MTCDDCGVPDDLFELHMIAADLGKGAFLKILCAVCWHRRQYRAELERRRAHPTSQNTPQRKSPPFTSTGPDA